MLNEDLKALRTRTGMNRTEFADYFGIPADTVKDWERGRRKPPQYLYDLMVCKLKHEYFPKEKNDTGQKKQ